MPQHADKIKRAVTDNGFVYAMEFVTSKRGRQRTRLLVVEASSAALAVLKISLSDVSPVGGW